MARTLLTAVVSALVTLHAGASFACDAPLVASTLERALRAESEHASGVAIDLRASLLACPTGAHTVANQLALARDHATLGDFARAADLVEALAVGGTADALLVDAMGEAIGYRVALRDMEHAKRDAMWLLTATGPSEPTMARVFEVGAALEEAHMGAEATQWYQHLATRFPGRAQWRIQVRALTGLARA